MSSNLFQSLMKGGGLALPFFLVSCSSIPLPSTRIHYFNQLIQNTAFTPIRLEGGVYTLGGAEKRVEGADILHVYLEGDGVSWIDGQVVSDNPTPTNPIGLRLAMADRTKSVTVLYLSRPCQYIWSKACTAEDWTRGRFSEKIRQVYLNVLEGYQHRYNIRQVVLHGYSGGGTMALLLAPYLKNVKEVITFAALFDTDAWVKQFSYLPLTRSLNPAAEKELCHIPQRHYVSQNDEVVPLENVQSYLSKMEASHHIKVHVLKAPTHEQGWEKTPYFTTL